MYVSGKMGERLVEESYQTYVTDALKYIATNTANINGGSAPKERFIDLLKKTKIVDHRTGDQIVEDVCASAGIEVLDG